MRRALTLSLYVIFVAALCWICFIRPVSGDFDRYIYEALVRGRYQDVQKIYPIVKHENPRAEASSVLDSPEHLGQLEPLYAIRPLYLEMIEVVAGAESIQRAINFVSVLSLFRNRDGAAGLDRPAVLLRAADGNTCNQRAWQDRYAGRIVFAVVADVYVGAGPGTDISRGAALTGEHLEPDG